MNVAIYVTVPNNTTAKGLATALRDAAKRAAGQIEQGILPHPLPIDETIMLGSDTPRHEAELNRSA